LEINFDVEFAKGYFEHPLKLLWNLYLLFFFLLLYSYSTIFYCVSLWHIHAYITIDHIHLPYYFCPSFSSPFPRSLSPFLNVHSVFFRPSFVCYLFVLVSTYEITYEILVFLCLTNFAQHDNLHFCPFPCKWHDFILYGLIKLYFVFIAYFHTFLSVDGHLNYSTSWLLGIVS
jgi:hypothetical protein